jgi:hypothetical protein
MKKFLSFFSPENWPTIVSIVTGVVIIILGIPGKLTEPEILLGILGVLTLVAFSIRLERTLIEKIIQKTPNPNSIQLRLVDDDEPFEMFVADAKEIFMVGPSLSGFTQTYRFKLKEYIRDGVALKVLLINPEGNGIEIAASRAEKTKEEFKNDINYSLKRFGELMDINENLVEVKLLEFPQSLGVLMVDGNADHGKMRIATIPPKCDPKLRPQFTLTKKDNEKWYQIYHDQFKELWDKAITWKKA